MWKHANLLYLYFEIRVSSNCKDWNDNLHIPMQTVDIPPLTHFNDWSRRAALRRVMIRVSNSDEAPRETAHAARTADRSEKRPYRSGAGGFSLNYCTYATSARVNHLTMPRDGRYSLTPFSHCSNPFASCWGHIWESGIDIANFATPCLSEVLRMICICSLMKNYSLMITCLLKLSSREI